MLGMLWLYSALDEWLLSWIKDYNISFGRWQCFNQAGFTWVIAAWLSQEQAGFRRQFLGQWGSLQISLWFPYLIEHDITWHNTPVLITIDVWAASYYFHSMSSFLLWILSCLSLSPWQFTYAYVWSKRNNLINEWITWSHMLSTHSNSMDDGYTIC